MSKYALFHVTFIISTSQLIHIYCLSKHRIHSPCHLTNPGSRMLVLTVSGARPFTPRYPRRNIAHSYSTKALKGFRELWRLKTPAIPSGWLTNCCVCHSDEILPWRKSYGRLRAVLYVIRMKCHLEANHSDDLDWQCVPFVVRVVYCIGNRDEIAKSSKWLKMASYPIRVIYGQCNVIIMAYNATLSHLDDIEEFEH